MKRYLLVCLVLVCAFSLINADAAHGLDDTISVRNGTALENIPELPLAFANIIVQRVDLEFDEGIDWRPVIQSIGQGNADIFIGGRYIPGYWVRNSLSEPTVFYDDTGAGLRLNRGKTYIAHFPAESRCTFTEAD